MDRHSRSLRLGDNCLGVHEHVQNQVPPRGVEVQISRRLRLGTGQVHGWSQESSTGRPMGVRGRGGHREKEFLRSPIAKIPPGGYKIDQYSKSSIQYLEWVSRCEGVKIQYPLNEGEVKLPATRYKLDGYCHETNTVYEFHGCVFHRCPRCFLEEREETKHPLTRQSMSELYALTMKKKS